MGLVDQDLSRKHESLFLVAESVPDRSTKARDPRPGKFNIVVNNIKVGFRPDKYVVPHIKAQAASNMAQEMVAAHKVSTAAKSAALQSCRVKVNALSTDSSLQFCLRPFAQRRRVDSVHIIEIRTEGLKALV